MKKHVRKDKDPSTQVPKFVIVELLLLKQRISNLCQYNCDDKFHISLSCFRQCVGYSVLWIVFQKWSIKQSRVANLQLYADKVCICLKFKIFFYKSCYIYLIMLVT